MNLVEQKRKSGFHHESKPQVPHQSFSVVGLKCANVVALLHRFPWRWGSGVLAMSPAFHHLAAEEEKLAINEATPSQAS